MLSWTLECDTTRATIECEVKGALQLGVHENHKVCKHHIQECDPFTTMTTKSKIKQTKVTFHSRHRKGMNKMYSRCLLINGGEVTKVEKS